MSAWQPIETAPKDGRMFLAYRDGCFRESFILDRGDGELWRFGGFQWTPEFHNVKLPTHWMPLPEPPKDE